MKKIFLLVSVVGLFALTGCGAITTIGNTVTNPPVTHTPIVHKPLTTSPQACSMIAKLCPDGSAVGRTGPNCEFAPCPGEK